LVSKPFFVEFYLSNFHFKFKTKNNKVYKNIRQCVYEDEEEKLFLNLFFHKAHNINANYIQIPPRGAISKIKNKLKV